MISQTNEMPSLNINGCSKNTINSFRKSFNCVCVVVGISCCPNQYAAHHSTDPMGMIESRSLNDATIEPIGGAGG